MTDEFKPGDVVRMKSGGVRMTVDEIQSDGIVLVWMDGPKRMIDVFNPHLLVKDRLGF